MEAEEVEFSPTSKGKARLLRGGSWLSASGYCRAAYRSRNSPSNRSSHYGFGVALSPGR